MTKVDKDKIILELYDNKLLYLKGELSEDKYNDIVNKNIKKLSSKYTTMDSKLKAVNKYISNYFRSHPSLENIDKLQELKDLEKEFNTKNKEEDKINNLRYIYNSFINYCSGIGKTNDENEEIFIDILDNFNYKSINSRSKITKRNALSTKYNFFMDNARTYYVKTFNKRRVDFLKYINELEEKKKTKYTIMTKKSNNTLNSVREKIYNKYIEYLNDEITMDSLINYSKKNGINQFCIYDCGLLTSEKILKTIEIQVNKYAKDNNTYDYLNDLRSNGKLTRRLKREGKVPLYSEEELKIIRKIYNNFINYYDMKIDYDTYINNQNKLVEDINKNSFSYSNKYNYKYYINYYLKVVLNKKITINKIIYNSRLYNKCFIIFRDFSYNKVDYDVKEFIDKYRVNIYNYAKDYAVENNLLDMFNEMDKRRIDILKGNYKENNEIDYNYLINKYINSYLYLDDFIVDEDINKKDFNNYINYLKAEDNKLYVRYNSTIIGGKRVKDKFYNNKIKNLYKLIIKGINNREFTLLDYYLYCDKYLHDYDRINKLSKSILKDDYNNIKYIEFLNDIKSNDNYYNKEDLYNNTTYKGENITLEDINYILDYIDKNNIPKTYKIFNEVINRYFNNRLSNYSEEILNIKEKSYKDFKINTNSGIICTKYVIDEEII